MQAQNQSGTEPPCKSQDKPDGGQTKNEVIHGSIIRDPVDIHKTRCFFHDTCMMDPTCGLYTDCKIACQF